MEKVVLPYGTKYIAWPIDKHPLFNLVKPKDVERTKPQEEIIREGIASPYGDKKLSDLKNAKN